MRATATNIWSAPAYLPHVQPPLTPTAVADAERKIGFRLPAAYLDLLNVQNGGYIRYRLPDQIHNSIAGIGPYFPSLNEFDWDDWRDTVSFPLDGLVPFDGDGQWELCLDYREGDEPAVSLIDTEFDSQSRIANSFEDYLSKLVLDSDDKWIIRVGGNTSQAANRLASILNVEFDPPDDWAHGYMVYRARLGGSSSTDWIWLSPNVVPRGFVRRDDKRYRELCNLLPGTTRRYPELPADCHILELSDGARAAALNKCEALRLVPLSEYVTRSERQQ